MYLFSLNHEIIVLSVYEVTTEVVASESESIFFFSTRVTTLTNYLVCKVPLDVGKFDYY